jgi:hypothetical protein
VILMEPEALGSGRRHRPGRLAAALVPAGAVAVRRVVAPAVPRGLVASAAVLLVVLAGCSFLPSTSPGPTGPASLPPSSASAAASPMPSGSPAVSACPVAPTSGRLTSDRLVGVVVDPAGMWVRFQFGPSTGPAGQGRLELASPPFDQTASGQAIEVVGERVVRIHFDGLLLFDELGNPTYGGPDRIRPAVGPIRDVVVEEAFEGVMNWLVGVDGPGCIRLRQGIDPLSLELVVAPME